MFKASRICLLILCASVVVQCAVVHSGASNFHASPATAAADVGNDFLSSRKHVDPTGGLNSYGAYDDHTVMHHFVFPGITNVNHIYRVVDSYSGRTLGTFDRIHSFVPINDIIRVFGARKAHEILSSRAFTQTFAAAAGPAVMQPGFHHQQQQDGGFVSTPQQVHSGQIVHMNTGSGDAAASNNFASAVDNSHLKFTDNNLNTINNLASSVDSQFASEQSPQGSTSASNAGTESSSVAASNVKVGSVGSANKLASAKAKTAKLNMQALTKRHSAPAKKPKKNAAGASTSSATSSNWVTSDLASFSGNNA